MLPHSSKHLTELLKAALQMAELQGVESHKVKLLLSEITSIPLPALTLEHDKVLTQEQAETFRSGLQRLFSHEPVQYILGKTGFYGLQICVNENVLIPRPETEGLVEWIASREQGCLKVLDIGTGSGAIALALKHLKSEFNITATDISVQAVRLAKLNAAQLGLKVNFQVTDLFPKSRSRFDLIVSNPPYISDADYALLDDEISFYEPRLALLAAGKGLEFYERILKRAGRHLSAKGKIYFEIGETQAKTVTKLARRYGFSQIETKQDLTGRDRYLCISA